MIDGFRIQSMTAEQIISLQFEKTLLTDIYF